MKRSDWILVFGIALYSFLFYNETAGVNFFLFSLCMVSLLPLKDQTITKQPRWWIAAAGAVFTGFMVMWFGNTLSFIANILSLSLLSSLSISPKSSVFIGVLHSIYSYLSSFVYMIIDAVERIEKKKLASQNEEAEAGSANKRGRLFLILVPIVLVLLFFFLYRSANPVFAEVTKDINLDFITLRWVGFTFTGLLLMYGFFYYRKIDPISNYDVNAENVVTPKPPLGFFDKALSLINENLSGIVLLAMLNLLLLFVNVVDVQYLYLAKELPEGMNFSDMVHQSVGVLIVSIIFAISILLFYFRGRINFYEKNKPLKILAYIWMAQNVMLIASTAFRNQLYIEEFSLTYKRIGVYVWLILTLIGLIFTLYKVARRRSNWFLVRSTGWGFYAVLLLSVAVNWNVLIAEYNIDRSVERHQTLDFNYLKSLGDSNLPLLVQYRKDHVAEPEFSYAKTYRLGYKINEFITNFEQKGWKSWCREKQRVYDALIEYEKEGVIEIVRGVDRSDEVEEFRGYGGSR